MNPRTLPMRLAPLPGEALESWLGTLAQRLAVSFGELLDAIVPVDHLADFPRASLTTYLHPGELAAIATATGVWPATVQATTLARYDGHLVTIDRPARRLLSPWTPTRTRFCPECLRESGGRWQLAWRLPWIFTCADHSRILADTCASCGQFQRTQPAWLSQHDIPELERCCRSVEQKGKRRHCQGNLQEVSTLRLTADQPIAMTQALLSQILSSKSTAYGVYKLMPVSSRQFLADLRVLTARILGGVNRRDVDSLLRGCGNSPMAAQSQDLVGNEELVRASRPKTFATTTSALITGLGLTMALTILGSPSIDEAGDRLRPILRNAKDRGRAVYLATLHGGGLSTVTEAIHIRAVADTLNPIDQLRYRTTTSIPRYPNALSDMVVRGTPSQMWREWAFRLAVGRTRAELTRPALSMLLLCTGTQVTTVSALRRLGLPPSNSVHCYLFNTLYSHPLWTNIAEALYRLADYLAVNSAPIDYQRRRQLNYRALLPAAQWNRIYDSVTFGIAIPGDRVRELLRSWLFERISMQPVSSSPFAKNIHKAGVRRDEIIEKFTPATVRLLDEAATDFLRQHGIVDEPVEWSPPLSLVADLQLPGTDLTSVPTAELRRRAAATSASAVALGRHFAIPTSVVRYVLETAPPARTPRSTVRRKSQPDHARSQLPKSEIIRLHHHEKLSIVAIAARIGVEPKIVSDLARKYGIYIRGSRTVTLFERDWIFQEYVVKQRSLSNIAQELGVDVQTVSRAAKKLGITIQLNRKPGIQPARPSVFAAR